MGRMTDVRLPIDGTMFALRAGIICVQDGQLLVIRGNGFGFKYLPGGAVNVGGATADAAAREWKEETGLEAGPLRLVGVIENFFELDGKPWHEIGFYYEMVWLGPALTATHLADQADQSFEWISFGQLPEERVYPEAIRELLNVPAGEIRHLVERSL